MADYTLDAAAPQMVAGCGATGVVRGAAGGCSRETTVNGVADNRPMPGIELPACLPAHHRWARKTDADAGSWRHRCAPSAPCCSACSQAPFRATRWRARTARHAPRGCSGSKADPQAGAKGNSVSTRVALGSCRILRNKNELLVTPHEIL